MPLELTSTTAEKVVGNKVNPLSPSGKTAKIDGAITVTPQPGGGDATAVVGADGLSYDVVSGDLPVDTIFVVEADADLGGGVETISDQTTYHVTGEKASSLGQTAGTVVLK